MSTIFTIQGPRRLFSLGRGERDYFSMQLSLILSKLHFDLNKECEAEGGAKSPGPGPLHGPLCYPSKLLNFRWLFRFGHTSPLLLFAASRGIARGRFRGFRNSPLVPQNLIFSPPRHFFGFHYNNNDIIITNLYLKQYSVPFL